MSSSFYDALIGAMDEHNAGEKRAGIVFGTVKTEAPLSIELDSKLILPTRFLTVAQHLTDYEIPYEMLNLDRAMHRDKLETSLTETNKTSGFYVEHEGRHDLLVDPHAGEFHEFNGTGTIQLLNHLMENDRVILERMENGNMYVVLDRIGEGDQHATTS